jgi:hypothetical protein
MGDTERPSQHEPAGPIVFTRAAHSLGVIVAQKNLGDALRASGEQQSGTAELEQAVSAYDEALQEPEGSAPQTCPSVGAGPLAEGDRLEALFRSYPSSLIST